MSELSNEYIEDAFVQIRARFEKRNNEIGLEILDGHEEQWAATGSLSSRQIEWLEKQLDGSWQSKDKQSAKPAGNISPRPKPEFVVVSNQPPANNQDELLDAMIQRKLTDEGKAIVDLDQLDALAAAIDKLRGTSV